MNDEPGAVRKAETYKQAPHALECRPTLMSAAASQAERRASSSASPSGAGKTESTSLRAASAEPAAAAQAVSEDTPGTTSTGQSADNRANRYRKEP